MKKSRVGLWALTVAFATVLGCQSRTPLASLSLVAPEATGATLNLRLDPAEAQKRGLLFLEPTNKVRVIIEGPDMATPFTVDATPQAGAAMAVTVKNVPRGAVRVMTYQWLSADGTPIDGLLFRAIGSLATGQNDVLFNNATTAEGNVLLALMKLNPEVAKTIDIFNVGYVVSEALSKLKVPNGRLLDADVLAAYMVTYNAKIVVEPKPEWAPKPGFVAVGFKDFPPGVTVRAGVGDAVSHAGFTGTGDTLLLGPIPPRTTPYKLKITPMGGTGDLTEQIIDVVVQAGVTATPAPISFVKSTPGTALPERVGQGGGVAVTGSEDALWMVNGLKHADTTPTSFSLAQPLSAAGKAYRYTRAGGWTSPLSLGASFPIYGFSTVSVGSKIYCIGGYRDFVPTDALNVIETSGTPSLTTTALPQEEIFRPDGSSFLTTRLVAETVAGAIGTTVYMAGGHRDVLGNLQPYDKTAILDTTTGTWTFTVPPDAPLKSMAGAVVGGKWYVFGGYEADLTPRTDVQVFDPTLGAWVTAEPMPTPRYGAAAVAVDGKIFVIGGEERKGRPSRAVEVYDPASDSWTRRAPLATPRSYPAAGLVKSGAANKIVVSGGVSGTESQGFPMPLPKSAVEEITP